MDLFLVIVIFAEVVLSAVSNSETAKELKAKVERAEVVLNEEREKITELSEMIASLDSQTEEDLASLKILEETVKEGIDKHVDLIIKYRNDLIEKYKDEGQSLKEIEELEKWINLNSNKLDLLKQDHEFLVTRRKEGEDLKCQKLISNSSISMRSLISSSSSNDGLVYSTLLRRLDTELIYARRRHDQLQKEAEHKLQLSTDIKMNLEEKTSRSTDDLVSLGYDFSKMKKEVDQMETKVNRLHAKVYRLERSKKSIEAQINRVVDDLKDYEQDLLCFKLISRRRNPSTEDAQDRLKNPEIN